MTRIEDSKTNFYRELLRVAVPVFLQQMIIVTVNMVDTVMVGNLSENALAGVGAANQIYFIYIDMVYGLLSGASVFAVQYWGIRDLKALRKILGIAYVTVLVVTIPTIIGAFFFAPNLIGLFTSDVEVIMLGSRYIRIACFTYFFGGLTFVASYFSRTTMTLKWPTIINAVAICINIVLNYGLIYGKLGMPALGVEGAAIATLVARGLEFVATYTYVYMSKGNPLGGKLKELIFDLDLFKRVMKTALPVTFNEVTWVLSFTTVFAIYGRLGPMALAVVQVSMTITDVFQIIYVGVCSASNVVVGQALGQGKRDLAFLYSKRILAITWGLNIIMSLIMYFLRGPISNIYDFNINTTELLLTTLTVYAIAITPKMIAYVVICGILRPGGDTMWCFYVDGGLNWALSVPVAWIAVEWLGWPLPACVALVAATEAVKATVCYIRFYSKKWMNVFTGR